MIRVAFIFRFLLVVKLKFESLFTVLLVSDFVLVVGIHLYSPTLQPKKITLCDTFMAFTATTCIRAAFKRPIISKTSDLYKRFHPDIAFIDKKQSMRIDYLFSLFSLNNLNQNFYCVPITHDFQRHRQNVYFSDVQKKFFFAFHRLFKKKLNTPLFHKKLVILFKFFKQCINIVLV